MRAAKTTKKTHSASVTKAGSLTPGKAASFFRAAGTAGFMGPVMRKATSSPDVQTKLAVSKPADSLEKEADRTAEKVMHMPANRVPLQTGPPSKPSHPIQAQSAAAPSPQARVQRPAESGPQVLRLGEGTPTVAAGAQADIKRAAMGGGEALTRDTRAFMEPRLGADLSQVRVHADESAHSLSNHLSARAFTYRDHIFFGRDQYQPGTDTGRQLLAHELTHTIQQGATVQRAAQAGVQSVGAHERVPVTMASGSPPIVQRFGLQSALDYFADQANVIPGYRMLTLVLGFNPINMRSTDRSAANFLRALIELVPGGAIITRVLDNHGVINKAAAWVEQKVASLGDIGSQIVAALKRFVDSLGWRDLLDFGGVWDRAKRIFTDPIGRLISFGVGVVGELLSLVKQAILRPLAALAQGTAGYDLLKAILGQDPITGDPVPRTADTLIGGFMKLIGQEEVWQNIKRGNAVGRAFAWFEGALAGLMGFVRSIPQRIVQTITSLTFQDVLTVVGAFQKVGSAFLRLAAQFGSWALNQVLGLLEILVSVVAPGVMPYIAKAKAAFHTIIRDPVRFIGNLVRAGKLGFQKFADNFVGHLKTALIKWITGPLGEAGVYIPTSFSLIEIVKLVLSVLALTWQNIRTKLLKIIPEPVLAALEKTASVLVTLVTQGPAAAWEQIKTELTELKDQLIGQVTQMVTTEVVKAAVTKLVSILNPAGAVIQAIIATYNTVMFFVEKARQIGAVVASFIDSIAAIAAGQVEGAANRVEQTLANTLTVVIAFLAKFVGLGGVPAKIVAILKKIRQPIDRGLDKIVAWLGKMLDKLIAKAKDTARKLLQWWKKTIPISGGDEPHTLAFQGEGKSAKLVVQSDPTDPATFMKKKADDKQISPAESSVPVAETGRQVSMIRSLQNLLEAYDKEVRAAASGERAKKADSLSKDLDTQMRTLAAHFLVTFRKWGVKDEWVKGLQLSRKKLRIKWTIEQKRAVAAQHLQRPGGNANELRTETKSGEDINVRPGIDRRHVVSLGDMARHYEKVLNNKKASKAKLLLEERTSTPEARVTVEPPADAAAIKTAVIERWRLFFGYATNIYLGPAWNNQRLFKEKLDTEHPDLQEAAKLEEHVSLVKRAWALDNTFEPSRLGDE
jgi:hypothetical protein